MTSLIEPTTLNALSEAIADAAEAREPVEVLGGGALRGCGRPVTAPRTVSTRRLTQIHYHEPDELVISLEAGVPMDAVDQILLTAGQQLAFEPPNFAKLLGTDAPRTIGGVIASNLSGPRRFQAGAARDHLLGFNAVNGRGEVVKSGGRVVKNVTGYDLSKLIAGSWGTLAVLSTVTLKVLPRPETAATLLVPNLSAEAATRLFARALAKPLDVTGAAWLPAALAGRWANAPIAALRLEGLARSVAERLDLVADLAEGAPTVRLGQAETKAFWRGIGDAEILAEPRSRAIWRVSVPPTAGPGLLAALPLAQGYLDWAGGLAWLAMEDDGDCGAAAIAARLAQSGGHASLVRASTETRATLAAPPIPPTPLADLNRRVKAAFDPLGVLNPGRLYRDF